MLNLVVAYTLILIVLVSYSVSLYRRTRQVNEASRVLDSK